MKITMFDRYDLTKQGKMKKQNSAEIFNHETFIKYAKDNNITGNTRYIDNIADLTNGKMIKCNCSSTGIMLGTTSIINSIN